MPRATNNINDTKRVDLKSLPDGYVVLRRMSYGQWLKRSEMAMTMKMEGMSNGREGPSMDLNVVQTAVAVFEFANCIAEHNLTDHEDNPLDFKQAWVIDLLDPIVGQEIGMEIDKMNQFEVALGNSSSALGAAS